MNASEATHLATQILANKHRCAQCGHPIEGHGAVIECSGLTPWATQREVELAEALTTAEATLEELRACPACTDARTGRLYQRSVGLEQARDSWRRRCQSAERELERWRHGVTIEGDFVCPNDLRAINAEAEVARLRAELAEREKQLDPESIKHWDSMREERDQAVAHVRALLLKGETNMAQTAALREAADWLAARIPNGASR